MKKRLLLSLVLLGWTLFTASAQKAEPKLPAPPSVQQRADQKTKEQASSWLKASTGAGFIENKGQLINQNGKPNKAAKYLLNMPGLKVQLRQTGFSYDTYTARKKFHRVDIELPGANPKAVMTTGPAVSEPANVINENGSFYGIRKFASVTYHDIYPGIDLEFVARRGTDKPVEYNFIVHPGADASRISLKYKGARQTALRNGRVVMDLNHGKLSENIPASWVRQTGKKLNVRYKSLDGDVYAFNVPAYDKNKTLIIDPTPQLEWATFYGGSGDENNVGGIDSDDQGNLYAVGNTTSTGNIASAGAFQGTFGGGTTDAFIVKFNSQGQRQWGTYYGGASNVDFAYCVTYHNGQLYVGGLTGSDGMATAGAFQATRAGASDAFFARFDAGSGLRNWATYAGATLGAVRPTHIVIDQQGDFYSTGLTIAGAGTTNPGGLGTAGTFRPTIPGANTNAGTFLIKFSAAGQKLWGTFLENGGSGNRGAGSVALDAADNVYVTGISGVLAYSGLVGNVAQGQTLNGTSDGYLLKMDKANGTRLWGRYFGGPGSDLILATTIDKASGQIYVAGSTNSTTGIASAGAFRTTFAGATTDGYWARFDLNGLYNYGTYLGGQTGDTQIGGLDLDQSGNLNMLGITTVTGGELATDCSYQPMPGGSNDLVLNRFSTASGQRVWGTYLGESGIEVLGVAATGVATKFNSVTSDPQGNIYVGFTATSPSAGLTSAGVHQQAFGGGFSDAMYAKFNEGAIEDFTVSASTLTPMTQNACILGIPGLIEGNAVGVIAPASYQGKVYYQWQQSDSQNGPWTDMPGEVFKDLQPLASQTTLYYRRLIKVNAELCSQQAVDSSQVASVLINANAAPIANANGPQWYVCGAGANTVTLNGSATGGSGTYSAYQWYIGSTSTGTLAASTASFTTTPITQATTYTLKVTDAAGCIDIDQVTVAPAVANAGPAQSICQGNGGVQIGTPPVASPSITYNWTLSGGGSAAATLSCTSCAQPIANPAAATTYRLTVAVTQKNGTVCSTTSDVTVTPVTAPNNTLAFAGTDKTICKNTPVVLGGTNDPTFAYTWTPGQYLNSSTVANPTFNAGTTALSSCSVNYLVTATKNGCAFTDEVNVSVINNRLTNQDETICGPAWVSHLDEDNCAAATYSWSVVSGDGTVLQTRNGGEDAYLKSNTGTAVFRRTVTLNGVTCSADVSVQPCAGTGGCDFEILTLSEQGCPKVFGATALKLGTTLAGASNYNFSWSPANLVDNATAPTVNITSTAQATITVTVTNKFDASITCSKSIVINPPGWSLPVFTTTDKYTCPNVPVQIGNAATAGFTYAWTPTLGLSDPAIANPMATVASTRTFAVVVTEAASGCKINTDVTVNSSAPIANAGNDRAVCNGATVTLGSVPPAGTNWVYSWEPANTSWANGTDANDAQPQVQFAFATPQSYILTVTDPLSGCVDKDTVVLSNTVASGEYAGSAVTTCEGLDVQIGSAPQPTAVYAWFMADGVTPATGLSSNTVANPTVIDPTVTTTYVVHVSYPGCSTPMTDQVTVTVNAVNGLALTDKTVCPAGPIAIGYGAPGNPAAPAGATYLWSPATGLSSTTAANPTATITSETTYTVTVTLTSGCTFTDQVVVKPSANAGSDATICPGESTVIGAAAIAGATYAWSGAGIVSGASTAQPTVKPTVTTTYSVSVTLNGCTTSDNVVVTVNTPADFAITGNTAICSGGVASLSLSGAAPASTTWQWSPLAGVSSPNSTSTTVAATSTQTYRLTQTSLITGCSNYKEVVVTVSPNTITATLDDISVCQNVATTLPLNVTSSGSYSYVWTPSTGLSNAFVANPTVTTSSARTYTVTITDNTSQCQLIESLDVTIKPASACLPPVTLSGSILHDANALNDVSVNTTSPIAIPAGLFVTLVDANGAIVKTVPVNPDGTYDFGVTAPGNYSIVLNQNPSGSTTPSLPTGWVNTGENLGTGVGSDDAVSGILTNVNVLNNNVTNANLGVQQPPVADPKTYVIDQPQSDQEIPLNGTLVSTGTGTSSPAQMTGTDPEDGTLAGTGKNKTVVITTLPDHGELWYNGILVTTGQVIPNYDPALMVIKLTGTGYTEITFEYAYVDQAGAQSPPVTYQISWGTPLPVTLVSFEAKAVENAALLSWVTTAEANSDRFEIERSLNGKKWETIGTVNAQGESASTTRYTFRDLTPAAADNYYRLKMIDRDLTFSYSGIRSASFDGELSLELYPNPVHEVLTIQTNHSKVKSVKITNVSGLKVYGASTARTINVKHLPDGVYVVTVTYTDDTVKSRKVVLVK